MLKKPKSNKKQTLSEKVTALIAKEKGAATDESSELSDDSIDSTRVADFDEEYEAPDNRTTAIRKRNIKLLDEQSQRYKGEVVSRNNLNANDDDDNSDFVHQDDEESIEAKDALDSEDDFLNSEDDVVVEEEDDDDNDDDDDDVEEEDDDEDNATDFDDKSEIESDTNNANDTKNTLISETNKQAETLKGLCVQNQLCIWEKLLELRIHTQKFLTKSNQLVNFEKLPQNENVELKNVSQESVQKTTKLLQTLLELQVTLQKQNPEINETMKNLLKRKANTETSNDAAAPPLKRLSTEIGENFNQFRPYRNEVLLKWYDRTKLLTPGAGAKKKSLDEEYDIVKKIENTLANNRKALIEKSQQLKNTNLVTNSNNVNLKANDADTTDTPTNPNVPNVNIYDDSDFYHQQLRELIEYKAGTTTNINEVTKQYIELQKLRQKMKKKVDTRASKGRKLRYVVHKKLINFMAPNDTTTWTDESKDELYKSLFAA